jgi:hypothetical protein
MSFGGERGNVASIAFDDRLGVFGAADLTLVTCMPLNLFTGVDALDDASGKEPCGEGELLTLDLYKIISANIEQRITFTCLMHFDEKSLLTAHEVVAHVRDEVLFALNIQRSRY